ncbi:MAG: hypothetical protein WAS73_01185 [Defluviicoccus sp.]
MTPALALAIAFGGLAATALVFGGYVLGVRESLTQRRRLGIQLDRQAADLAQARAECAYGNGVAETLKDSVDRTVRVLLQQGKTLQEIVGHTAQPLAMRDNDRATLKALIAEVLAPVLKREQIALAFSGPGDGTRDGPGQREALAPLLDRMAEIGGFETVLLTDGDGSPLAASAGAGELDRAAAVAPKVLAFADSAGGDDAPQPLALVIHDDRNRETLCRIFHVGARRLLLLAVANGVTLTATALDPALPSVEPLLEPIPRPE